jgi:hypothetical protein
LAVEIKCNELHLGVMKAFAFPLAAQTIHFGLGSQDDHFCGGCCSHKKFVKKTLIIPITAEEGRGGGREFP